MGKGQDKYTWEHMAHIKLRQSHVLTQNKNTSTWPAKQKSPVMSKTRHEHAANENMHKPRVHTRHDNMKARSQWNTQAACNNTKHTWTAECAAKRSWDHTLTQRDRTWSTSVQTPTLNRNSRHECQDPNTTLQNGRQTRERTARARSKPNAHMKTGHDESVRALSQNSWMTPDRSDRTLTQTLNFQLFNLVQSHVNQAPSEGSYIF